jgi:hypothetical protein
MIFPSTSPLITSREAAVAIMLRMHVVCPLSRRSSVRSIFHTLITASSPAVQISTCKTKRKSTLHGTVTVAKNLFGAPDFSDAVCPSGARSEELSLQEESAVLELGQHSKTTK